MLVRGTIESVDGTHVRFRVQTGGISRCLTAPRHLSSQTTIQGGRIVFVPGSAWTPEVGAVVIAEICSPGLNTLRFGPHREVSPAAARMVA